MATSYTANRAFGEPAYGDTSWDVVINPNFTTLDAILGASLTVSITSLDVTLTQSQANNMRLLLTGVLTGNRSLILPATGGEWIIDNQTSGSYTVTVKTSAVGSTGVVVPQTNVRTVFSDGTNVAFSDTQPITNNSITNAELAQMAAGTVKANLTGATADATDATIAQLNTALPVFVASGASHAQGLVPDPGSTAGTSRFLREDATWVSPFPSQSGNSGKVLTTDGASPSWSSALAPTAWGSITSSHTVESGYNVASASGSAPVSVTFTNAASNSTYSVVITPYTTGGSIAGQITNRSTTGFSVAFYGGSNVNLGNPGFSFVVFGG